MLGIKTIDEVALKYLRTMKRGKKYFQGTINYEILSNLKYSEMFQYQSVDLRNEKEDFESSDFVTNSLYFADIF